MEVRKNESDDKISKSDIYSGILFWTCVVGLLGCACLRGCQEVQKKSTKAPTHLNPSAFAPHNVR